MLQLLATEDATLAIFKKLGLIVSVLNIVTIFYYPNYLWFSKNELLICKK